MIGDAARLAHCRVRVDPRDLRLPPGVHHRRPLFRRLRRRRIHRHAPRSAAAAGRLRLAVRAGLRPRGRAPGRCDPRQRLRGARRAAAPHDRAAGHAVSPTARSARSSAPRSRSAIVWIVAAVAAQTPGQSRLRADIQQSAILRKLNEVMPPSGAILDALARLDPLPSITGPSPDVRASVARRWRAIPACGRVAQRRARDRHGVRARRSRARAGWRRPTSSSPTRTWWPASRTPRCRSAGSSASLPAEPIAFDPADDIAVLRVPELGLPPLRLAADPRVGHRRRDPRLSRERTVRRRAGAHRAHPERPHPGRLRARPGLAAADAAARPGAARATRVGPLVDSGGDVLTTVFAATVDGRSARRLRRRQRHRRRRARATPPAGGARAPRAGEHGRMRAGGSAATPPATLTAMSKTLLIAEKPSVGQDLARVLPGPFQKREGWLEGPEHVITWAVGHLVQLAEPESLRREVQELADGGPADRAGPLQARRPRRALAQADVGRHQAARARRRRARSSTPATPGARAS